jgi:hypothetical protein
LRARGDGGGDAARSGCTNHVSLAGGVAGPPLSSSSLSASLAATFLGTPNGFAVTSASSSYPAAPRSAVVAGAAAVVVAVVVGSGAPANDPTRLLLD